VIERLLAQYRSRGALLDSNLLLLLVVGLYRRSLVGTFKRLRAYTLEDFTFVQGIVAYFARVVVTPNVLTEVSNLAMHLGNEAEGCLRIVRDQLTLLSERHVASNLAASEPIFLRLGLTDAAIVRAARSKLLVFTDDLPLTLSLQHAGLAVVNLNHLRSQRWMWS